MILVKMNKVNAQIVTGVKFTEKVIVLHDMR